MNYIQSFDQWKREVSVIGMVVCWGTVSTDWYSMGAQFLESPVAGSTQTALAIAVMAQLGLDKRTHLNWNNRGDTYRLDTPYIDGRIQFVNNTWEGIYTAAPDMNKPSIYVSGHPCPESCINHLERLLGRHT